MGILLDMIDELELDDDAVVNIDTEGLLTKIASKYSIDPKIIIENAAEDWDNIKDKPEVLEAFCRWCSISHSYYLYEYPLRNADEITLTT